MSYYGDINFNPDDAIGYLLRRAHQTGVAELEPIFADEGLTGIQWSALAIIHTRRSNTSADVARDLSYDRGATTRLVDRLEERGWVRRERSTDDRRVVRLATTEAGAEVTLRAKRRVIARWNEWLKDWDDQEITTLILLLRKLRATLDGAVNDGKTC